MTELGEKIRVRREALDISQQQLAEKVSTPGHKVLQQTIARVENGTTKWTRSLPQIIKVLGLDETVVPPNAPATAPQICPEIPILAISEDGDAFEMTGLFAGVIARPTHLSGVPGVYAIYMRGSSMSPMYRSGDLLIINPHQPPRPEDGALFLSADRDRFVIGEFVRESATEWTAKRWGEKPAEFKIAKEGYPICECVNHARKWT